MTYTPKILIVDDKPQNLLVLETTLHPTQADIIKANNGDEALRAALRHDFALVILDVKMPGIDGYELAELLRGRPKTRHIPIIFLSAVYSDDFHVFKGYESGAVDFLVKPFNPEILLNKVYIFLELDYQKKQLQALVEDLQVSNERLNHEITERCQAEARLQHYANQLQDANAELSQYAYVVSHDLKAPLRAIHNYAQFLREDLTERLEAEQAAYFDGMHHALEEANTLIHDILELSRVGRHEIHTEPVELAHFLTSLLQELCIPDEVDIHIGEDWPTLEIAPVLLRQVFQNLIHNAIKFNTADQKRLELGWQMCDDHTLELFVRDNGIGIKPEFAERIFRVFERLHSKEEFDGTGIGLAIVKKAVGKLGGTIRMESQPGSGSTFFIRFPGSMIHFESTGLNS